MKNYPIYQCMITAQEYVSAGHEIYQKFQCEKCKAENYMEEPNNFYEAGKCEDCGHITNLIENGCNYLLVMKLGEK